MKRLLFIINPIAGPQSNKLEEQLIYDAFKDVANIEFTILYTEFQGHGLEIIEKVVEDSSADLIVLSGGDGTIHEALPALVHCSIPIAILPSGSGNGLAHHLKIPINKKKAIELITTGKVKAIDIAQVENKEFGKKYFHSNFGLGYDAEVIHSYATVKQRGFFTYMFFMVKSIFSLSPKKIHLSLPQLNETLKPFVFTVANSSQYGYKIEVAPDASITDGVLDSLLVRDATVLRVLKFAIFSMLKIKDKLENEADFYRAEHISIDFLERTKVQIDGEPFHASGITEIGVQKQALKVIVPN